MVLDAIVFSLALLEESFARDEETSDAKELTFVLQVRLVQVKELHVHDRDVGGLRQAKGQQTVK